MKSRESVVAPGSNVFFIDSGGKRHNALVMQAWKTKLNIIYVEPDSKTPGTNAEGDSFGNRRVLETSVPWHESGMDGFYVLPTVEPEHKDGI